ncbi:MAG: serine/threonine-protein kinase [Planctomycetota bacterium]
MQHTCPSREQLRQFLEGSVDTEKGTEITAHIEQCSSCDEVLSSLESEQIDVLQILREGARTESLLLEPEFEQLRDTFKIAQDDTAPGFEEDEQLEPGKRLRDYRLIKKIGEGGMGTVYQAVHIHLAKPVAIKILPADKLQSRQSVSRFRQEMRAVGRVSHANVVSASDAGKIDGQHFLVMELVKGADLARIIQGQGTLSVADACEIVRQTAIGLQHAHDSGLIHRDVKPSNVMLATDGNVKLLDLGLAGLNKTELGSTSNVVVSNRLTSFGQIMGTLDYMAPEQVTASPDVDVRADVYALGATLFQLLTGKTPCGNRSQETSRRIEAILNAPPADISDFRDDIPVELQALLLKMLAKHPAERPQAASDVASEIASFASGSNLVALADACQTSLDIPSADVEVTDDASFLFSHTIAPEKEVTRCKPRTAIGFVGVFLALVAASVFFFVTHNGVVKVEVFDENVKVSVDGKFLEVDEDGSSKVTKLWANDDHKLVVSLGGKELITEDFEVRRGDELVFKVEFLEGKLLLQNDGKQVGSAKLTEEQLAQTGLKRPDASAEDWKSRLTKLVDENQVVMVAKLEKGQFTGKLNVHRIKSPQVLKGKQYRVKAAFAHLAFSDDYLPLNNRRPSPSMPELEAGEYLLILKADKIVHSSAASSFGFTITPNPSFNFAIVRDGRNHATWKKDSREAQYILEMFAKEHDEVVSANNDSETYSKVKASKEKTLADLPASDLAVIYQQLTGVELGVQIASDKPSADLANSVNILLQYESVSPEEVAKSLVELGRPELAKIVLSEGRTDPAATEALKLGDFLMVSGDGDSAVDAYLEAFRLSPRLFNGDKHIAIFDKQNRLKELAELFTEERISQTNRATPQTELLKRLMQDDTRATIGLAFMARQWNALPDIRGFVSGDIPWDEVPNRLYFFRPLFVPSDIEAAGNDWHELFSAPDVHGGWLVWLSDEINEETAQQLLAEIEPKLEQHKKWIAGEALLAVLEAKVGNYEPAKQWLTVNYESVVTPTQDADRDAFLATYAEFLGSQLEGKDRELDLLVIELYEQALEHRHAGLPYRDSKIHALAKLYNKYGRADDARELMYGLVERESKVDEYLIENFGRAAGVNLDHERIWDLREAAETLNSIGQPMDSLALLSRITFEQRRKAGVYKGGGWYYDDKYFDDATRDSQKLVTQEAIIEAINRGVIPVGLTSTINMESGKISNSIVELLKQVATDESSDEVRAAFDHVNPALAGAESMDHHLAELLRRQPDNTDVAMATTIFAFLRDDIDAARECLSKLTSILGSNPATRAADVSLVIAADYALQHETTAKFGRKLADRAKQAGELMNKDWKQFFKAQKERQE